MSWGTLSGSDGAGLSGEKARASWLTPSARGTEGPHVRLPQVRTSHTHASVVMRFPGPPASLTSVCNF